MNRRLNFYLIEFPDKVDLKLSDMIGRIANGRFSFSLIMQKEGLSPLQFIVTSYSEILGVLQSVFAGAEPQCKVVKLDVLRSTGYRTGLNLRHLRDAVKLNLSQIIHSSMRSLRPNEKLRAVVCVNRVWQSRPTSDLFGKGLISFHLLFAGEETRLAEVFPVCMQRRMWKCRKAWKVHPSSSVMPVSVIDTLLPSPNETSRTRSNFPKSAGSIRLEGIRVRTASGEHPLHVDDRFLKSNTLVFGGTGSGKSSFLLKIAIALMRQGRPVCVIDPHGTLATAIMGMQVNSPESGKLLLVDPIYSPLGLGDY